jgi:5-methylcytosine-specific restriction endonuclease McrA
MRRMLTLPDSGRRKAPKTDKRYGTPRWKRTRLLVLARDLWRCQIAPGCPVTATVADHINPVYEGMPDFEFYGPANLRAACKQHNVRRGVAARLLREMGEPSMDPTPPRRFSYGGRR